MLKKVELLAPAGNVEKLEMAFHYGADAFDTHMHNLSVHTHICVHTMHTVSAYTGHQQIFILKESPLF